MGLRNGGIFVPPWVAWVGCFHEWHTSVGAVGAMLALVAFACVAWLRGWRASVCSVGGMLTSVVRCYYCYCYYWNTFLKKKMLNVYFWNKDEKFFQIDLNSDRKEEPEFKSRCCFTLFEPVMPESWICLNQNVGKYASICVTLWICPWICAQYHESK